MFTQTFVHNNEKYAVIEGTMSSIRTLNSKQNQLYIDGRMAVSTKAMNYVYEYTLFGKQRRFMGYYPNVRRSSSKIFGRRYF